MNRIFSYKSFWLWLIVFLLIVNLSTMITVLVRFKQAQIVPLGKSAQSADQGFNVQGRHFIHMLDFSSKQINQFEEIRRKHFNDRRVFKNEHEDLKREIVEELSKNQPDTTKLKQLAKEYGEMQATLKQMSFVHFSEIKEICDEEQKMLFNKRINRLIDDRGKGPGHGFQHRHRRMKGFNN